MTSKPIPLLVVARLPLPDAPPQTSPRDRAQNAGARLMRLGATTDACMSADATHRAEMELAGQTMLAVLRGSMTAPRGLRWRRNTGGYSAQPIQDATLARIYARDHMAEMLRRSRDACPWCAVRADIGCKHRRMG